MNSDIHLGYVGGSGGFLALHLLLLSNQYHCWLNKPFNDVVENQWRIDDPGQWKSKESWPNNEKTKINFSDHRLFFYCAPGLDEWEKIVDYKILIYTDLELQLKLSKYKNAWMYLYSPNFDSRTRTLDYQFEQFYNDIKDPLWPDCHTISQVQDLPAKIQNELNENLYFCNLKKSTDWDHWFLSQHQHYKLNNQIVYSGCFSMAQHSNCIVDLKDIIRTQGKALLEPLGLEVTDQQINLIEHWVSLHPENILEHLKIEQA